MWLVVLLLVCLFYYSWHRLRYFSTRGVPTLPPVPLLGNLTAVTLGRENFVDAMAAGFRAFKDYRYFGIYQYLIPTLVPKDPELIRQIAVRDFASFSDRGAHIEPESDGVFGRSIIMLTGSKWRTMRTAITPAFSNARCRNMMPLMLECTTAVCKHLKEKITNEVLLDINNITLAYVNDVIASCAFGFAVDSIEDPDNCIYKLGKKAIVQDTTQIMKLFGYENLKSLMKVLKVKIISEEDAKEFSVLFKSALKARRENLAAPRPDFIQVLVEANEDFSDDDLVAQAVLFYIAGFDTTTNLINYFLYEMAHNQHLQEKLYAELEKLPRDEDIKDIYETIQALEYLEMCVSEVLRLWPMVSSVDRRSKCTYDFGPIKYGGEDRFVAAPNIHIWLPLYSLHRDEKYWSNPNVCDPERFSAQNKANIQPYTYLPFGTGPRHCIGSRFAILTAKVFLVYFLRKYRTRACYDYACIDPKAYILRPRGGFNIIVEPRK